jgi:nitrite reductase/ring-hydroxylating ferredoxin subunit
MFPDRQALQIAPSLEFSVTYRREIGAGIARIWENVFDWEHLPVLHGSYFNHVELREIGEWGWRVELTKNPGTPDRCMLLELRADRANARYRVQTLAGDGIGTEIWTLMERLGPQRTAIEVRYYLPEQQVERLAALGEKYESSCQRLWDEDEAMMTRREALLARPPAGRKEAPNPLPLGRLSDLRCRLPLLVEFNGEPFRIVEIEGGNLVAHATICPHWLGPLEEATPENWTLRCPWHGYLFDIRTGESADGRGYRLSPAPCVVTDSVSGEVCLVANAPS